jgi:hypothetical protein
VYGDTLTAVFLCAAGKFNTGHGATGRFYRWFVDVGEEAHERLGRA